ncbi:MAG: glutathione S-transferase family protein, partial [Gammaproteobacteria bacterium]
MKLYHCPHTRSVRPLWLLEELGADYEIETVDIFKGEGQKISYKAINPNGSVPTLDDGTIIYEAGAICLYLADKYPEAGLAPAINSTERAKYYQWMFYVPGT